LDKRGDNLKWLPLASSSLPALETFDWELRKKLVIHKTGLLMGFYDLLEHLFVTGLKWPHERETMWQDPAPRRAKIDAKNVRRAQGWDQRVVDRDAILQSRAAKDLELLVDYLRERKIPLLIVWLPVGNMDIVRQQFSPRAQQNLEAVRRLSLEWSRARGVTHIDLVDGLPGPYYDDFTHLRDVRGNQIVANAVAGWVVAPGSPP
jgi:hypothetical protein